MITIGTAQELQYILENREADDVILSADIDMTDYPIKACITDASFLTFDGNGKTISNIVFSNNYNLDYFIKSKYIKNLIINGLNINDKDSTNDFTIFQLNQLNGDFVSGYVSIENVKITNIEYNRNSDFNFINSDRKINTTIIHCGFSGNIQCDELFLGDQMLCIDVFLFGNIKVKYDIRMDINYVTLVNCFIILNGNTNIYIKNSQNDSIKNSSHHNYIYINNLDTNINNYFINNDRFDLSKENFILIDSADYLNKIKQREIQAPVSNINALFLHSDFTYDTLKFKRGWPI